jgi:signal transduction histidine kinase
MSLRAKILLWVALVNLGVTAFLATFFVVDLQRRERELQDREAGQRQQAYAALVRAFGGRLELEDLSSGPEQLKKLLRQLLDHPVRTLISDGILLNTYRPGERGDVRPTDLYVNLFGAKDRAADFDAERARRKIRESIETGRVIRDDPWIAVPIAQQGASGDPWGGGYFQLSSPPTSAWIPTFQPRTLVSGMILGTLLLVVLTYLLLERWIFQPVGRLASGAARVYARNFEQPVSGGGGADEVGRLITSFNAMMAEVGDAQHSLTQRVQEATQRAEESRRGLVIAQRLAATGTLASGIAHEINNPLGGMLNAALRLRKEAKEAGDAARTRYLTLLVQGLERIQEIVRRVLQFSPRSVAPQRIRLQDVVMSAAALAEHRAQRSQVKIELEGADAWVLAGPGELQQVFLNLFINACDALSERGGTVRVRVHERADKIVIEVADDGPGMTEEECERAFDLFFTTKEVGQGTGLGLSVAHHILSQHSGSITVTSKLGEGCRFMLTLPRPQ